MNNKIEPMTFTDAFDVQIQADLCSICGIQEEMLPDEVEQAFQNASNLIREETLPKKKKRHTARNWLISLGSFAAAFAIFFGIGAANPAWATQIPLIGGMFQIFQEKAEAQKNASFEERDPSFDERYFNGDLVSNMQQVSAFAVNDGLKISIEEVSFDGLGLVLSVRATTQDPRFRDAQYITSRGPVPDNPEDPWPEEAWPAIQFKGQELTYEVDNGPGLGSTTLPSETHPTTLDTYLTRQEDGSFTGALIYDIDQLIRQENMKLPNPGETLQCTLTFPHLIAMTPQTADAAKELATEDNVHWEYVFTDFDGSWSIDFPATLDTSRNKTLTPNQTVNGCILKTVELTPSCTKTTFLVPKKQIIDKTGAICQPALNTFDETGEKKLYIDVINYMDQTDWEQKGPDDYIPCIQISPYYEPGKKVVRLFTAELVGEHRYKLLGTFTIDVP